MSEKLQGKPQKISRDNACHLLERCAVSISWHLEEDALGQKQKRGLFTLHMDGLGHSQQNELKNWIQLTACTSEPRCTGDEVTRRPIEKADTLTFSFGHPADMMYFGLELQPISPKSPVAKVQFPEEKHIADMWRGPENTEAFFNSEVLPKLTIANPPHWQGRMKRSKVLPPIIGG